MRNTRKLLYSLYAAGVVAGASTLSGCYTRTIYVTPDGYPTYAPTHVPAPQPLTASEATSLSSGILMGIGQVLSVL